MSSIRWVVIGLVLLWLLLVWNPPSLPAQNMELYTKMANRLVELLNAGDYAAIDGLFSKEMKTALPPPSPTNGVRSVLKGKPAPVPVRKAE